MQMQITPASTSLMHGETYLVPYELALPMSLKKIYKEQKIDHLCTGYNLMDYIGFFCFLIIYCKLNALHI